MSRLSDVRSYAVYYQYGNIEALRRFDLIILQPGAHSAADLASLRSGGAIVLAYLSVGEEPATSPAAEWHLRRADGGVARNPDWGTVYVDTRHPAWRHHLVHDRIPFIREAFDGLFLDTLDSVDRLPHLYQGTVGLVRAIRRAWDDAALVVNRGFSVLEAVCGCVDGVVFESFSTYGSSGGYHDWAGGALRYNETQAAGIHALQLRRPLAAFALDYASARDTRRVERAARRARRFGLLPYVTTADLGQIFFFPETVRP